MASIGSFGTAAQEAEGERDTFEFYGVEFQISDRVGAMPVLKFSHAAHAGLETSDLEGLAAMYDMIKDCLRSPWDEEVLDKDGKPTGETRHIDQMKRFEQVATENRASPEEILEICRAIYEALTARPTKKALDSSSGPPTITASSSKKSSRWSQGLEPVDSLSPQDKKSLTG